MVLRIMRRFDSYSAIEDCGSPLVGLTTNKAIELIETGMGRPPIEGPGHGNLPRWRFVVFPKGCCAITVLAEYSANGATLLGRIPVLPGKAVASSMIAPALFTWWLRPVSNAVRVGEQRAVV